MITKGGLYIPITYVLKDAALKAAERGMKRLGKSSLGLNKTLLSLGATVGIAEFARKSVQAAVQMEAANAKLSVALTSVGKAAELNGMAIKKTATQMSDLGFQGDQTAQALANLVTITGSLEKAQSLMGASADAARYLGTNLSDGANKLGSAFAGTSKALAVFNIKLDKTLKPAEAFDKAMGMLNAKIGGQAAAYAQTYAGKLEILRAKFFDVQEQVGYKLLPVLIKLGDFLITTGIPKLEQFFTLMSNNRETITGMAAALTTVAVAFKSIATFATLAKVAALPIMGAAAPFVAALAAFVGLTAYISATTPKKSLGSVTQQSYDTAQGLAKQSGGTSALKPSDILHNPGDKWDGKRWVPDPNKFGNPMGQTFGQPMISTTNRQADQAAIDAAATAKAALALAKKEAAIKAAEKRKIDAEKKLSAMFDLNQIALANALKLKLTEKERAAVEGLLALEDDGYKTETQRMLAQEAALRKLIELKGDYASMSWDKASSLGGGEKQVVNPQTAALGVSGAVQDIVAKQVEMMSPGAMVSALQMGEATPSGGTNTMVTSMPGLAEAEAAATQAMAGGGTTAPAPIVVNINAPMVTPEVVDQISVGLQNKLRAGGVWYSNAASG